jgi:hypothetical protein
VLFTKDCDYVNKTLLQEKKKPYSTLHTLAATAAGNRGELRELHSSIVPKEAACQNACAMYVEQWTSKNLPALDCKINTFKLGRKKNAAAQNKSPVALNYV